jgi:hypothetical protein
MCRGLFLFMVCSLSGNKIGDLGMVGFSNGLRVNKRIMDIK